MTTDARHPNLTPTNGGVHVAHAYEYANSTARTTATGLTAADEGKLARQLDDDSFWVLVDYTGPTWTELTGAGSPLASIAPVNVTKAAAAVGTGTTAARDDHKHDATTAAPSVTGVATSSGEGSATTLARSDHSHQANTSPSNVTKAAAVIGTSGEPARADHKHDITTATASELTDSTNAEGSATSLARSDHTHAHGDRSGGSLHADATTSVDGFMSASDKTKLDGLASGASKAILTWGDDNITTTTTTRYLTPGFDDGTAETSETAYRVPSAGTAQNLRVRARVAGSGAATLTYTLIVNGSPSSLSVAMSNTTQDGSDLVNTVSLSAGDLISMRITKSASLSSAPDDIVASLEVTA